MRIGYWRLRSSAVCNGSTAVRDTRRDFSCLRKALEWSSRRGLLYFRVPTAMLPETGENPNWKPWKDQLERLGAFVRERGIRLSIRPGMGMYLSTASDDQFRRWASRLLCLAALLDMMNLDSTHKIQIAAEDEVGIFRPVAREADLARFDERQRRLPEAVQRRLVIESPHRHLALRDSLKLWNLTGIPIVYRTGFASVESLNAALGRCRGTWAEEDGLPVVDLHSPDVPSIDRLLAIAPEADYMLEADRLPDGLPTGRET